jgi:Ca-activated chloride channel family protein
MPTLKGLRTAAGLSQTELANASGVSLETIKKIEGGKVERPHPATLRQLATVLGQVPALLHSSRNGHIFDPSMFDNARRDQGPELEIMPDAEDRGGAGFVPLRESRLTGVIEGPLAALSLSQRFGYRSSECDRVLEARYRFPLPGDSAVTGVKITFGEVVVETSLVPRDEAEVQYAAARQAGRQAALTTRESPDVFTLQVTGLQPDEDIVVETNFIQLARPVGPGWELRVPQTVGPRYTRADESRSPSRDGQPLALRRDPRHSFALDLVIRDAATIVSPTHALASAAVPDGSQKVRLRDGSVLPDRDLVLVWHPAQTSDRPMLDVLVHEDLDEGTRYFLALVAPPATQPASSVDREVTLLVDGSGSMAGPKWDACRWAVRRFVAGLRPSDTFNLGVFQSTCDWLAPAPRPGTDTHRERALRFLDEHAPDGGTELGPALEQALRASRSPGDRARHVLLLTDAQVSDEGRILQLVEAESRRADRRSLSLICIDAAPKSAFVHDLAEAGGGVAVFLSSDPDQEDITAALDRVLDIWARPLAADVKLVVEARAASLEARGARSNTRSVINLGDLPAGRSLWVSGAISLFSDPVVRLCTGERVLMEVPLEFEQTPASRPEIRALFGAHQLGRLERLGAARYDEATQDALLDALGYAGDPLRVPEPAPLYAENAARLQISAVQRLLVRESLSFGLVCSATAFVGMRTEVGRRSEATVLVPSALPAGWDGALADRALRSTIMPSAPTLGAMGSPNFASGAARPQLRSSARRRESSLPPADNVGTEPPGVDRILRFRGIPVLQNGTTVLAEGVAGEQLALRPTRLRAAIEGFDPSRLDELIELWMCIGDSDAPAIRVFLRELLALGGERPVNLSLAHGVHVWVRLHAQSAPWPAAARLVVEVW